MTFGFVENGRKRLLAGLRPVVKAQVEAEFAERLAAAAMADRAVLRREIEREIATRIQRFSSPDALY